MNSEQKQKLRSLFKGQDLLEHEKDFWFTRLASAPPAVCDSILEMFALFPAEIGELRAIQERKERSLANGDWQAWSEIIQDELRQLAALSEKGGA